MAVQDLTTWTEHDTDGWVTVTSDKADFINAERGSPPSWVETAMAFNGDYEIDFEIKLQAVTACSHFLLDDNGDDALAAFAGDAHFLQNAWNSVNTLLDMGEVNGGVINKDRHTYLGNQDGLIRYCTMIRDESIGLFGQLKLEVYTDSNRPGWSLEYSLTQTLTEKKDLTNICAGSTYGTSAGGAYNAYTKDVDIIIPVFIQGRRRKILLQEAA